MDLSIEKILRANKVKGVFHTHVSMGDIKGKYQFNRQDLEEFWKVYIKTLNENPDIITGIAEKSQHYLPVLGDIDIKIRESEEMELGNEIHLEKHTKDVISVYQSVLRKIVEECTDQQLTCVLLEKPLYRVTKNGVTYAKHGFHVHFPYCFLNKVDQEVHLIPRVQEMITGLRTFEDLGFEDSGLLIDKSCCKVPWLLYGSRKENGMDPYKVTKVYNSEGNEITLEKAFKSYKLFDMQEKLIKISGKVVEYLPRILSIIPYGRESSEVKNGLVSPLKEKIQERKNNDKEYKKASVTQELAIAKQLIPMLSLFRATDRNEWMTIGWILYNIGEGCPEALDLWCEFSSRCEDEYDEAVCIYQWERMTRKDITLGTLRYYASVDSPEKYMEFKKEQATKYIHESLNGSHNDIAKVLHAEYGNEFVCASVASKAWFQFIGHKWEQIEDGVFLRKKISGEIVDRYMAIGKEILTQLAGCTDKGEEAMYNARLKQVQKMMGNLKSAPYKSNIMKECLCSGSKISLSNGLSIQIEEMSDNYNVFGWDKSIDRLSCENQTDFMYKGEKECVELTLEDGTTISMTPDHPVLTSKNVWIEAKDLKIGEDRVKTGITFPVYNPREEMKKCDKYNIHVGEYEFTTDNLENYEKTLSFSRILGFLLTDGCISLDKNKACVCMGNKLDIEIFLNDLEKVCGKRPKITESNPSSHCSAIMYNVYIPFKLTRGIVSLKGVVKDEIFPEFILSPDCPLPILREFLGGMFGGDGYSPCIDNSINVMRSVGFSKTKFVEHTESLHKFMDDFVKLLGRFGINKVTKKTELREEKCIESSVYISIENLILFADKIGYRYCLEKSMRLTCIRSYRQMYEKMSKQQGEIYKHKFSSKNFPDPMKYMDMIGIGDMFKTNTKKYFLNKDDMNIPLFSHKLVGRRNIGVNKVYDISVNNVHSFVANGAVVHNCMEVFYDKRFREKLDTNPALFPFNNGVYDLIVNIFRPGRPEDFISKTSPIDYIEMSEDDERVHDVHDYLEKVFPDRSVRIYFTDIASDIFMGGNHQKHVYFLLGEGDNSKSIIQTLFEKMLGHLAIKFNTTVITGKKVQSGAANPELARAGGGVRLATLEEPNSDEMINIGILKNLSGNDSYYARDLFEKGKDGREIIPMFKLFFICFAKGVKISMSSGLSVSIEKLTENHRLLSWDDKTDGLLITNQQKFFDNGEQECVTLTLADGRELTCTPNHKLLTTNNEWVEAKDINIYDTQLKMGIDNPNGDDVFDDYDYIFEVGDLTYNLYNHMDRLKASALCRLIGYVIIDGYNKVLCMEHLIDCEGVLEDISLLTNKIPSISKNKNMFQISIPLEIIGEISKIIKVNQYSSEQDIVFPDFMFDKECPTFLIRELLAGMFGGHGVLPSVKNSFTMMRLVASKDKEHVQSLVDMFTKMSEMMKERFGIESTVSQPTYYENYKTDLSRKYKYNVFLMMCKYNNILKFIENIGVRYCCNKSYTLMAIASIIRYKNTIYKQNQSIVDRTRELLDKYKSTQEDHVHYSGINREINRNVMSCFKWGKEQKNEILDEDGWKTIKEVYEKAKEEVKRNMGLSDEEEVITYNQIRSYLVYENDFKLPCINIEKYLKDTGLNEYCNNQNGKYSVDLDRKTLPCYSMKVINKRNVGKKHVYDLNVDEPYSNFIAEGVVTHNCNKLPKLKYSDKAVWNRIRVIPFESTFCRSDDPAPDTYDEQLKQKRFPMDKDFGRKIPDMVQAFAWVLLQHRLTIKDRVEPEKVRMATAVYRKENDIYRQFVEECIAEDEDKMLSLTELYTQFKDWFRDSLPHHTVPIKNEVEEYFTKVWDEPEKGKKWRGYRIRTLQDDINDGDAIVMEDDDLVNYDEDGKNLPPM